jgi:hypothetical protein
MDRQLQFDAKDLLTMDMYNDTPFFPLVCVRLFSLGTAADDNEIRLSPICWASR